MQSPLMPSPLLFPMAAHVALTASLYAALTLARAPAVWGWGRPRSAAFEPRISANLSNQFEWPLFFHVGCVLTMLASIPPTPSVVLAWVFIAGRIAHSLVQILVPNIRLRGIVFTVNFLAVLGLWVVLVGASIPAMPPG